MGEPRRLSPYIHSPTLGSAAMFRFAAIIAVSVASLATAADPFNKLAKDVNEKVVKIFGAGGFRGATNYTTGIVVSKDGYILTIASQTLDTSELILHMPNGQRMKAKVIVTEPELDVALLKIVEEGLKPGEKSRLDLSYFDIPAAAARPASQVGDWVLAFSNEFEIAMRDEPVSIQRGCVMSYSKLQGRRGIFDFPYHGNVYVVDAICCNPGAGGGPLTDRKGNLLGIIGREIKNSQTDTWINYAIPIGAKVDIKDKDKTTTVSIPSFVEQAMLGKYKPVPPMVKVKGLGGYTGIRFVPNVVDRTAPYIDEIVPNSPAQKAGLRVDDLVSFIDGEPIYSIKAYQEFMSKTRPNGPPIRMEIRRGDALQTIELKLEEWPKDQLPPGPPPAPKLEPNPALAPKK